MNIKDSTSVSGQFYRVPFLLTPSPCCPFSDPFWVLAKLIRGVLQLIEAFLLFLGDYFLVLCDKEKKSQALPRGDKRE
jgi:hypothetical protein